MVYNIGLECGALFCGMECNSYLISGDKNIIIDTVPAEFENDYVNAIEKYVPASEIDCVFLLSALPQRAGAINRLLMLNPGITVYATAAGIRNLSEITERGFESYVCKNGVEIVLGERVFVPYITPNLTSPDTMILLDKRTGGLFTGELFSSEDGIESYFVKKLRYFTAYIETALEIIDSINFTMVYPLCGVCEDALGVMGLYRDLIKKETAGDFVLIAYSSKTGNNKKMAVYAANMLNNMGFETKLFCLDTSDGGVVARELNRCNGLVLCLPTENRSMPECVWNFLSSIDVNLVSGKPYFVFSSYGWSSEGVFMASEILSMLKMRRVCKFTECVFTASEVDKANLLMALDALKDYISKQKEKSSNA